MSAGLPPSAEMVEAACNELLRRASLEDEDPKVRLRCVVAAIEAALLPPLLRVRAHMMAGVLFHRLTEDTAKAVLHLRAALSLCLQSEKPVPPKLQLAVLFVSTEVSQDLLRSGILTDARVLLETLKGVLLNLTPAEEGTAEEVDAERTREHLSAHVGVLLVGLLLREWQLTSAERMLPDALEQVEALPATASTDRAPSRVTLRRALWLQNALILAQQGDVAKEKDGSGDGPSQGGDDAGGADAVTELDHLLVQLEAAAAEAPASGDGDAEAIAASLLQEARLARAAIHTGHFEVGDALALLEAAREPLAARAHGEAAWRVSLAHAALALSDTERAARCLRRALEELKLSPNCATRPPVGLQLWCELTLAQVGRSSDSDRHEALRAVPMTDDAKCHRLLRSALQLCVGEASLALGMPGDAEKRLARAIKLSAVGDSRCDAVSATALASLAASISAQADQGPGSGGSGSGSSVGEKRRRAEDSLSSSLMLAAKLQDLPAQRRALDGWISHYEAVQDAEQLATFKRYRDDLEAKLKAAQTKAKRNGATRLRRLADD